MHVDIITSLSSTQIDTFDRLYRESFDALAELAAARHLLSVEEFAEEMRDDRIDKYVAIDHGRPIAMSTLTDDLTAVPWISPDFYARRFPEHHARGAVLYLGMTLVHPDYQRSSALVRMLSAMCARAQELRAVVGYDICAYNNDTHDFAAATARVMAKMASTQVEQVDVQTYYAMTFAGAADEVSPADGRPSR